MCKIPENFVVLPFSFQMTILLMMTHPVDGVDQQVKY